MTSEVLWAINDLLAEIIETNEKCLDCELNHDGICFFAYNCIPHNFKHYLNPKVKKNEK